MRRLKRQNFEGKCEQKNAKRGMERASAKIWKMRVREIK